MARKNLITSLTKFEVLSTFKNGTCICSRFEDRNHIHIPLQFWDIYILCCCGVISLGPIAALHHQESCDRYASYSVDSDYVPPRVSRQNPQVEVDVPIMDPISLVVYKDSRNNQVVGNYKGRFCIRHHHNDLYVCGACGHRSSNYYGLIKKHQTKCDKESLLGEEFTTIVPTVKPVEQVLDEAQLARAEELSVEVEAMQAKRNAKARVKEVKEEKALKKRKEKVEKRAKKKKKTR